MTKPPLHVGIDATCWSNPRGFGRFTRELVTALAARKNPEFRYTLVFDQAPETPPPGVAIVTADARQGLNAQSSGKNSRAFDYVFRMGALAGRAKFDVFFYPAVFSYFPLLARTPCVVCYHDTIAERFPELIFPTRLNASLWRLKTAMAKAQAKRAMTVSQASADEIETVLRIPRAKIDVVTEAADPTFRLIPDEAARRASRERHGIPQDAPLFVYVGGFNRHKNVARLIEAFPAVLAEHPDARLALVGDTSGQGFWDNVKDLRETVAADPALRERVQFLGYVEDEGLAELLNTAHALVLPSLAEGFGLPAVEAMSCGAPVLASARGSLPEVVGPGGLFFDPENPADIAAAMNRLLGEQGLQADLATRALAQAATFSWDRAAALAEDSFRRCAAEARGERLQA